MQTERPPSLDPIAAARWAARAQPASAWLHEEVARRMEDRLQFVIEYDASLSELRMPPLLLQPLVENAIKHGLEPKVEGGTVRIAARRDGDKLVLTVQDDGLGHAVASHSAQAGNGVALANLRERLRSAHGDAASLTIRDAAPGTLATLTLPVDETQKKCS